MKNKVCFICCYFGKLPNYFPFWLKSAERNPEFNWLLFTDDRTEYLYPQNVHVVYLSFNDLVFNIKKKLGNHIRISDPYKLCDFRVAYGDIFSEYLKSYTHWGHCDLDLIWGDLSRFITDKELDAYDRLFQYGHCSIYRNTKEINRLYQVAFSGLDSFVVFRAPYHFGFDEFRGMNTICKEKKVPWYQKEICADINRRYLPFFIEHQNSPRGGDVLIHYKDGGTYVESATDDNQNLYEVAYVHFQKRKMKIDTRNMNDYYIMPNRFTSKSDIHINLWQLYTYRWMRLYHEIMEKIIWNIHWRVALLKNTIRKKSEI